MFGGGSSLTIPTGYWNWGLYPDSNWDLYPDSNWNLYPDSNWDLCPDSCFNINGFRF